MPVQRCQGRLGAKPPSLMVCWPHFPGKGLKHRTRVRLGITTRTLRRGQAFKRRLNLKHLSLHVLFNVFIFNQRIIAFQCCVGFCHISA